jgi:hypothetical protein
MTHSLTHSLTHLMQSAVCNALGCSVHLTLPISALYISKFQSVAKCSHRPVSLSDFGGRVNRVKCLQQSGRGLQPGSPPFGYAPAVNCTFTPPIHLNTCFSKAIDLPSPPLSIRRPVFAPGTPECARSSVRNTAETVFNKPPGCCDGVDGLSAVYSAGAGFVSWLGN